MYYTFKLEDLILNTGDISKFKVHLFIRIKVLENNIKFIMVILKIHSPESR